MQSRHVNDAPRHWLRCASSFFFVRTSPQFWTVAFEVSIACYRPLARRIRGEHCTSQEKETIVAVDDDDAVDFCYRRAAGMYRSKGRMLIFSRCPPQDRDDIAM